MITREMLGLHKSKVKGSDYLVAPFLADVQDNGQDIDYTALQSPVKNQGKKGACVGFSGVALKEYQEFVETGKFLDLSEQWLYEKARQRGGFKEGATLADAAYVVSHEGVPLEEYWPYTEDIANIGSPKEGAEENAKIYRIDSQLYFRFSAKQLRAVLLKYGPVHVGVSVYANWNRQKNGHIPTSTICERAHGSLGGHALEFCASLRSTKEYKFKNSWAGKWGDKGFGYITEVELERSFLDGFVWIDIKNIDPKEIITVCQVPNWEKLA